MSLIGMIQDAKRTSSALSIIIDDTTDRELTKDFIIEQAKEILAMFKGDENMFADELDDVNADVRREARNEMKRLERFIKINT